MANRVALIVSVLALAFSLAANPSTQTVISNNAADMANHIVMVADSTTGRTVSNLFTYNRGGTNAPFAVGNAGAVTVTNLDADLLDAQHGSFYQSSSNQNAGNLPYARLPTGGGTWTLGGTLTLSGGTLLFSADNTNDIGATGATRPRDLYLARNFIGKAEFDNGNSGASKTIDFSTNGVIQKVTRTANCTYTLTAPAGPGTVILKFIHESGNSNVYTVTFSPVPKYPAGTAPTFTNTSLATDILTFYYDGATWYASYMSNMS